MKAVKAGDIIKVGGRKLTITKVLYADYYGNEKYPSPDDGWMIEAQTDRGYIYWKQYCDGGELIQA